MKQQALAFKQVTAMDKVMRIQWMILIKNLAKAYLDNYILPGTNAGTEVLWIYMIEWKRHMANITLATFYLLMSQAELRKVGSVVSSAPAEELE